MTAARETGDMPAFPCTNEQLTHGNAQTGDAWPGMSLRQYYAGQALAGMLAHPTRYRPRPGAPANWHEAIAEEAFELADALLVAEGESKP